MRYDPWMSDDERTPEQKRRDHLRNLEHERQPAASRDLLDQPIASLVEQIVQDQYGSNDDRKVMRLELTISIRGAINEWKRRRRKE